MSRPPLPFRSPTEPAAEPDAPRPVAAQRPPAQVRTNPAADALVDFGLQTDADPLAAFDSEQTQQEHEPQPRPRERLDEPESEIRYKTQRRPPSGNPGLLVIILAIGILGGILALTYMALRGPAEPPVEAAAQPPPVAPMGQAQFDSRPSGADVLIDGVMRGKTPIKLSLPVGDHSLEIRAEAGTRSLPLTIEAGVLVSQYVELVGMPDPSTGRLEITSDPVGAQVRLDGVVRGVTPLTLDAVDARSHSVALSRAGSTVYRNVRVSPGATASVFASMTAPAAGAAGGFVALTAPFEFQVFEGGRLLGTTSAERLMLPAGRHSLQLVSDAFQVRTTLDVDIAAGRTATAAVPVPNGSLSVNALPWAEVFVDGRAVGTTPLANLTVPVGNHEVTWRHPELGERRQPVTITGQTPIRVGVNFAQ